MPHRQDSAFLGNEVGELVLAVRRDAVTAGADTAGDFSPLIVDASGRLWVTAGVGSAATDLGKAEDAAHASGDVGVQCLAVRTDTPANRSGTDGDYEPVQISGGYLWVKPGATESHLGQTGTGGNVVNITPVCDTSAYTAGDVLFDSTEIANAVRVSGGRAELVSVFLLDEDDQAAAAITLYFFRSNVSLGTANSAPNISDVNARECQGHISFAAGDFVDLGTSKVATLRDLGLMLEPTTGTSVWVAATCAGTPTQTASGIKLGLGFRYH